MAVGVFGSVIAEGEFRLVDVHGGEHRDSEIGVVKDLGDCVEG